MKKTLIAVAALSAMAASAMAANVTLSGVIDLGLNYQHKKVGSATATNTFAMRSGQNSGPRFMLKGSEDLGNGVEVGFQLENGFQADSGSFEKGGRLFHRESRLYVKSNFGTLHFGRFGGLDAGTGSVSIFGGSDMSAYGTGWADTFGKEGKIFKGLSSRYDNSIAYQSPTFAGFTLYLDHSFKTDAVSDGVGSDDNEGRPSVNQYNAAGLKYVNGAFNAAFVYSQQNYATGSKGTPENGKSYSLGAGYDFGVCKLMAQGQYFDMGKSQQSKAKLGVTTASDDMYGNEKGWGGMLAVTAPVAGGKVLASVGHKDSEEVGGDEDYKAWNLSLGYTYDLSKRTSLYVGASYLEEKAENATVKQKTKTTEVVTGIVHKF